MKQFMSETSSELPFYLEVAVHTDKRWRLIQILSTIMILLGFVYLFLTESFFLKPVCLFMLVLFVLKHFRIQDGGKQYKEYLAQNGGVPMRNYVSFLEDAIEYRNPDSGNRHLLPYSDIKKLERSHGVYYITRKDHTPFFFDRQRISGGTPAELEAFLLERTGLKKVRSIFDVRILQKAVMIVSMIAFLLPSPGYFKPHPVTMNVREAVQVLQQLGITPPEEEILSELETYDADEYTFETVLCYAGFGTYDEETWEWTPAESGIYAFDVEVFDVGNMYTNFLLGVEAMSRGALEFTDVVEDDSHVNWEDGTGWKEITLTCRGQTRSFRTEMNYDWFDTNFANELSRFLGRDDQGRRLRFCYDGYQIAYVFYCDDAWAEQFTQTTGLVLKDKLY